MRNLALKKTPAYNIWCDQGKEQKSLRNLYDQNTKHTVFRLFFPGGFYLAKLKNLKQIFQIFLLLVSECNLYPLTLASVLACADSVEQFSLSHEWILICTTPACFQQGFGEPKIHLACCLGFIPC